MKDACNVFDLWLFYRGEAEPRYLLLHTPQEKTDKCLSLGSSKPANGSLLR